MKQLTIVCKNCKHSQGYDELQESLQRFKNNSIHIRGHCNACGSYIKYVPYVESNLVKKLLHFAFYNEGVVYGEKCESEIITIYDNIMEEVT